MLIRNSSPCFQMQVQAKKTLAFFSDCENNEEWQTDSKPNNNEKIKHVRIRQPFRNFKCTKDWQRKQKNSDELVLNNSIAGRTLFIPCKVSLEQKKVKKSQKLSQSRNPFRMGMKENCKNMRATNSFTRKTQQKLEESSFDLMQYWIKHRFQDGAVSSLVAILRDKKNIACIRF